MDIETGRHVLVAESRELLANMEAALLEIERLGYDDDRINALFRAAHTIKGSSGLFSLTLIESFCQRMENVLDLVRGRQIEPTPELLALTLECGDYLSKLVDAIEQRREHDDPDPTTRQRLLTALAKYDTGKAAPPPAVDLPRVHHVSLRFAENFLADGVCPTEYLAHLRTLGEIIYLCSVTDALPERADYDASKLYLGFELGLCTERTVQDITGAFGLAGDQVRVHVFAPDTPAAELTALLESLHHEREQLAAAWKKAGFRVPAAGAQAAPAPAARGGAPTPRVEARMVKVDAASLDQLINLVGELVIASEGARNTARDRSSPREMVLESVDRVTQLVEYIRDSALGMRMTPIGEIFQRFPRVVRDVSRELGKRIELEITGADAELDKSMVERLADPLLHIVRNAIDHGIEPVAERIERGKPAVGHVRLHAQHDSGCIVIEVGDDGRGLDPERLRKKAIERGLIDAARVLSKQECHNLIFAPGFSTAETVTNLSGRGVGMDVVKRSLELLRGEIEIQSEAGVGTTFRLRLPLTLAIIEGFHVQVAGTIFVIPLDLVVECIDMRDRISTQRILNLREEPLPFVRLRDVFRLEGPPSLRESLLVVQFGKQRVGMVVDRLLGNSQAVIKPLGQLFRGLHGISASTIMGDGHVALILDVPALIHSATRHTTLSNSAPRAQGTGA